MSSNMSTASSSDVSSISIQRERLPIFAARSTLLKELRQHHVLVLIGETGSGKTTQIPQYIDEAGLNRRYNHRSGCSNEHRLCIAVTQPRRVAAVTVARRVAEEAGETLGHGVGYSVRFDDCSSKETRIKYMTDGMLLREALGDPLLSRYSTVILDEAHERTVHTDVLFALVKGIQKRRKDLRIIAMSATLDAKLFVDYFNNARLLYIAGRQFPVDLMYTVEPQQDYLDSAMVTALQIHQDEPPNSGDILVFLTGQEEIEHAERLLLATPLPQEVGKLLVCPVYAALPASLQIRAFEPTPIGCRKVILATNIAETSLTITGVRYVVDSGMVKERNFDARLGIGSLQVVPVSKAQARQRSGRAGRERSGVCYRLYPEENFDTLAETTVPEIRRCDLGSVVLQLKALGIDDVVGFDYMEPPSNEAIIKALEMLFVLAALDKTGALTPLGSRMAQFPLAPRLSKTLLSAVAHGCLEEMITLVALLSVDTIFFSSSSNRDKSTAAKRKFLNSDGDQMTLLSFWRGYRAAKGSVEWCREHFINVRAMQTVVDTRKQLRSLCIDRLGLEASSISGNGGDTTPVRKSLLAGFFSNVALLQPDGSSYRTAEGRQLVAIHPSSVLFHASPRPPCILYHELTLTSKAYLRNVSVLELDWLFEIAPQYFKHLRHNNSLGL